MLVLVDLDPKCACARSSSSLLGEEVGGVEPRVEHAAFGAAQLHRSGSKGEKLRVQTPSPVTFLLCSVFYNKYKRHHRRGLYPKTNRYKKYKEEKCCFFLMLQSRDYYGAPAKRRTECTPANAERRSLFPRHMNQSFPTTNRFYSINIS